MPLNPVEMLPDHWADFPSPRQRRCDDPPLLHRLCLSLCAVLCGAEPCPEMEAFGQAKASWFIKYQVGAQLALWRPMMLNGLQPDTSVGGGLHAKRLRAEWDTNDLGRLLVQASPEY